MIERLREEHRAEELDVERLEGFGLTAVIAAVRGTRTGALDERIADLRQRRDALLTG